MTRLGIVTGSHNLDMVQDAFSKFDLSPVPIELCEPQGALREPDPDAQRYFDEESFLDAVLSCCDREMPECVVTNCIDDYATIAESRLIAPLADRGIPFLAQPLYAASIALDKWKTKELCRTLGLGSPPGCIARSQADLEAAGFRNGDIVVFKRVDQSSGDGQEMIPYGRSLEKLDFGRGVYLAERFVSGVEISVNVFACRGNLYFLPIVLKGNTRPDNVHALDRVRLVVPRAKPEIEFEVLNACAKLCAALEPNGWLEFEFVHNGDGLYLIEINARFSGTSRISYVSTGVNPYRVATEYLLSGQVPSGIADAWFAVEMPLAERMVPSSRGEYQLYYSSRPRPGRIGRQIIAADSLEGLLDKIRRHAPAPRVREFMQAVIDYMDHANPAVTPISAEA